METTTDAGQPLAYRPEAAARMLGLGRTTVYLEIRSGRLRSYKVGASRLVPASALEEYIAARLAEADS